jgi:hypothetical protein
MIVAFDSGLVFPILRLMRSKGRLDPLQTAHYLLLMISEGTVVGYSKDVADVVMRGGFVSWDHRIVCWG